MLDPLTALSLASAVAQLVDFSAKICTLIHEYSGVKGMPKRLADALSETEHKVQTLRELSSNKRQLKEGEIAVIATCTKKAETLLAFLQQFKIRLPQTGDAGASRKWGERRLLDLRKVKLAFKVKFEENTLLEFQSSLDNVLRIAEIQMQSRTEIAVSRVEENTGTLIERSDRMQNTLTNLHTTMTSGASASNKLDDRTTQHVCLISQSRNSAFVLRGGIFEQIDQKLVAQAPSQQVRKTAICGLGGVGKTQIALEYGYRLHASSSTSVIWVYAANTSRFEQDYKSIAEALRLPGRDNAKIDVLELVCHFLNYEYKIPWLLIVDNVDNNEIFNVTSTGKTCLEYIPDRNPEGRVLFTSRNRGVCLNLVEEPILIPSMSTAEASDLLGERILQTSTRDEQLLLLEELDHLPLAIIQATKYMAMLRKTVSQYLEQFRKGRESKTALLNHKFANPGRRERSLESVATTWIVSFNYIREQSPRAAEILSLMSVLDRQSIPMSLIIGDDENETLFDIAIGYLDNFSLITMNEGRKSCSMHRLVQAVTNEWLASGEIEWYQKWGSVALKILSERFPDGKFESWPTCSTYMPHVRTVLSLDVAIDTSNILARANLLSHTSLYLFYSSKYANAKADAQESLVLYQSIFPQVCVDSLRVQDQMALILHHLGHDSSAEDLYRQTLLGLEELLGPKHLDTIRTVANLAYIIGERGKYKESADLARRALHERERQLGADHPYTLQSKDILALALKGLCRMDEAEEHWRYLIEHWARKGNHQHEMLSPMVNLGWLLRDTARLVEAEETVREALKLSKRIYGVGHWETLNVMSALGRVLNDMGRFKEAKSVLEKQIGLSKEHLGEFHYTTLHGALDLGIALEGLGLFQECEDLLRYYASRLEDISGDSSEEVVRDLAKFLYRQGKFAQAEVWQRLLLQQDERTFGRFHEETLLSILTIADILKRQRQFIESNSMYLEGIKGLRSLLGDKHNSTIEAFQDFSMALSAQDKHFGALTWQQKAVQGRLEKLGADHLETWRSKEHLAWRLTELRRYSEAEALYLQALPNIEHSCGIQSRYFLEVAQDYGTMFEWRHDFAHAEEWYQHVAIGSEIAFGLRDKNTLKAINSVARALYKLSKYVESEDKYRRLWSAREAALGKDDVETLAAVGEVASCLAMQKKYDAAEALYQDALKSLETSVGMKHEETSYVMENLAKMFEKQARTEEAADLRRRFGIGAHEASTSSVSRSLHRSRQASWASKSIDLPTGSGGNKIEIGEEDVHGSLNSYQGRHTIFVAAPGLEECIDYSSNDEHGDDRDNRTNKNSEDDQSDQCRPRMSLKGKEICYD
ncbi:TPR-like protein [Cadophora sp. DSE1049]|nr:TPR-like protein [Cadophora sp. DSE1049]